MQNLERVAALVLLMAVSVTVVSLLLDPRNVRRSLVGRRYAITAVVLVLAAVSSDRFFMASADRDPGIAESWSRAPDPARREQRRTTVWRSTLDRTEDPRNAIFAYRFAGGAVRFGADSNLALALMSSGEARRWNSTDGWFSILPEVSSSLDLGLQLETARLARAEASGRAVIVIVDGAGSVRAAAEIAPARDSLRAAQWTGALIMPGSLAKVPGIVVAQEAGFSARTVAAPAEVRLSRSVTFRNAQRHGYGSVLWPAEVVEKSPFTGMIQPAKWVAEGRRPRLVKAAGRAGVAVVRERSEITRDSLFWFSSNGHWRKAQAPWRLSWIASPNPTAADITQLMNGQGGALTSGAQMTAYLHAVMRGDGKVPQYTVESHTGGCGATERIVEARIDPRLRDGLRAAAVSGTARAIANGATRSQWPSAVLFAKTGTPFAERTIDGRRTMAEHGTAVVGVAQRPGAPLALIAYVYIENSSGGRAAAVADSALAAAIARGLGRAPKCWGGLA